MRDPYEPLIVESFISGGGCLEDAVHIRPIADQKFAPTMRVECSRRMADTSVYPLGTKFKIMEFCPTSCANGSIKSKPGVPLLRRPSGTLAQKDAQSVNNWCLC